MAPQHNHHTPGVMLEAQDGRDRLALGLSKHISPFSSLVAGHVIAAVAVGDARVGWAWSVLSLLIQLLPAMTLYRIRMRQGRYSDPDMSRRSDRNEMYVVGGISLLTSVVVLYLANAPAPVLALAVSYTVIAVASGVVNMWWKISMHASAIAAVATLATMQLRSLGAVMWVLVVAVLWARLHTRNHTLGQVVAGSILATTVVFGVFRYIVVSLP
ncbi:MAG: phosphatase PAP2 family protein [Chloroflexi bacterium]|nr:phosphatase PAP2 family protein [Chloroflexota bacterium]